MKSSTPIQASLPNGLKVFCFSQDEASILYEQVQTYLQHGITLNQSDTVFDIGANVGIFTIWLHRQFQNSLTIFAFEPVPAISKILKLNVKQLNSEHIHVFPYGISNTSEPRVFTYFPNASPLSTAYPDNDPIEQDSLRKAVLSNLDVAPSRIKRLRMFPPFLRSWLLNYEIKKAVSIPETIECQMKTVSQIIREHGIDRIDLLKVDVEKGEMDVLSGIEDQHWLKIRQIVLEVHNFDNRLEKIITMLKKHGFTHIVSDQDGLLRGSSIFNLYAFR